MPNLAILFFAAAASGVSTQPAAGGQHVVIQSFNNPDGAKIWTANCDALIAPQARVKVDAGSISNARDKDGCVYFESGGKSYWVKEGALTLAGGKTSNTDACAVYRTAAGSGSTVEAATMGADEKGSKATCK